MPPPRRDRIAQLQEKRSGILFASFVILNFRQRRTGGSVSGRIPETSSGQALKHQPKAGCPLAKVPHDEIAVSAFKLWI